MKNIINTYEAKIEVINSEIERMHDFSNWTQEMIQREELLESRYRFCKMRVDSIEEMLRPQLDRWEVSVASNTI